MAILDPSSSSTTNVAGTISEFSVSNVNLDAANQKETEWTFSKATERFGYYKTIPEFKSTINTLATWAVGKGWETEDPITKVELEHISGWGEDTFQSIMWNLIVTKKVVGDAFAEIIKKNGRLINLKPISPERMKVVVGKNGRIKRYETYTTDGSWKKKKKEDILHICNDRIGDEIHGNSVVEALKWVIDARNEALVDERMIKHRELALGVLYIDGDDTTKRNEIMRQYEKAVKNGEVLVLPKDIAELKDANVSPKERIEWIRYLENFFYQSSGVPKILTTSEGATEVGGKMGYLTFEPVYVMEQTLLEADLWNQVAIKVKFNRPPSLGGTVQEEEQANTGQTNIQPNDMAATMTPE